MTLTNPALSDLAAAAYHQDAMRATETDRRLALASGVSRRNPTLLDRTRHLLGTVMIRAGEGLQGARRVRPAVPHPLVPTTPELPSPTVS